VLYQTVSVKAGETFKHTFPEWFSAAWIRLNGNQRTTATADFLYE
jgi:hypothetical protein